MQLVSRFYPEREAGGYTRVDGSIAFYTRIRSLLEPHMRVLDFGAGRGWALTDDPLPFRRRLASLRGLCAEVVGVDVDPAVRAHPGLDRAEVIPTGEALPFPSGSFDLILSDHVFEHLDDPASSAAEIDRLLKPGGWICARTPNRWGYIGMGARLVPNRLHTRLLRRLQPERASIDVFPTRYRLNTRAALRRHFPPDRYDHHGYGINTEPAYAGRSSSLWIALYAWSRWCPESLCATWLFFLRKRAE